MSIRKRVEKVVEVVDVRCEKYGMMLAKKYDTPCHSFELYDCGWVSIVTLIWYTDIMQPNSEAYIISAPADLDNVTEIQHSYAWPWAVPCICKGCDSDQE